jgi:hypothetical protein
MDYYTSISCTPPPPTPQSLINNLRNSHSSFTTQHSFLLVSELLYKPDDRTNLSRLSQLTMSVRERPLFRDQFHSTFEALLEPEGIRACDSLIHLVGCVAALCCGLRAAPPPSQPWLPARSPS